MAPKNHVQPTAVACEHRSKNSSLAVALLNVGRGVKVLAASTQAAVDLERGGRIASRSSKETTSK